MAPKSKKAADTTKKAGAKYKDDRVPDPAVATEEYAAVSLSRCSTVEAIVGSSTVPCPSTPAHYTPSHMLPLLVRLSA
jgi:hypothetical protein